MYAVTATVEIEGKGGYSGMRQIPTFYLDETVQGILTEEHAKNVAWHILSAAGTNTATFHITAVRV